MFNYDNTFLKKFITLMLKKHLSDVLKEGFAYNSAYKPLLWMPEMAGCLFICMYSIDSSDMSKSKKQEYHWEEATCVKKMPFLIKSGQCLFAYRE